MYLYIVQKVNEKQMTQRREKKYRKNCKKKKGKNIHMQEKKEKESKKE